jgi:hypothetical protein
VDVFDSGAARLDSVAVLGAWGVAASAQLSGTLEARRLFVDQTRPLVVPPPDGHSFAMGVQVKGGGLVTLTDSTVTHGLLAGVAAGQLGTLRATGVLLRDVGESVGLATGAAASVGQGGVLELSRCALAGSTGVSLIANRGGEARARVTDSTIHGTHLASGSYGHGAAGGAATSLFFDNTFFFDNAAVALVAAGASALVSHSVFSGNAVALHAEDGSFLVESDAVGPLAGGELRVSPDSVFSDNGAKLGVGTVPLPQAAF